MTDAYKLAFAEPDDFHFENWRHNSNVWAIKQLRALTGVGLKVAKELIEQMMINPYDTITVRYVRSSETHAEDIETATKHMLQIGIVVTPVVSGPLSLVKQAAFDAMEHGDHIMAKDLLEVLIKHGGK